MLHHLHHGGHIWPLEGLQSSWTDRYAVIPCPHRRVRLICNMRSPCWLRLWLDDSVLTLVLHSVDYVGQHH